MRDDITIITDDDLHASLKRSIDDRLAIFFRRFDQSINQQISDSSSVSRRSDTEDGGGSGVVPPNPPNAGAAVPPFNLDACFRMGDGK